MRSGRHGAGRAAACRFCGGGGGCELALRKEEGWEGGKCGRGAQREGRRRLRRPRAGSRPGTRPHAVRRRAGDRGIRGAGSGSASRGVSGIRSCDGAARCRQNKAQRPPFSLGSTLVASSLLVLVLISSSAAALPPGPVTTPAASNIAATSPDIRFKNEPEVLRKHELRPR